MKKEETSVVIGDEKVEWLKGSECIITIPRLKLRKVGFFRSEAVEFESRFRGDGTVWHSFPDGRRVGVWDRINERALCDMWTKAKWKRELNKENDQ